MAVINISPATSPRVLPVYYHMRGYYQAGQVFEYWSTTDPFSPAPSGNSLIDITQVAVYN